MMTSLVAAVLAASVGPVAFPVSGGFLVLSRSGTVVEKLRRPGGMDAESLAVSPDGERYVFTARDSEHPQPLLYKLERTAAEATLLGGSTGFHAQPTFTNDGAWVYFIHHPSKDGGPPGMHGMREYGQVWKVRIDGTGLEQVTKSKGCKLFPDGRDARAVTYTHTNCEGTSMLETLGAAGLGVVSPMATARPHLPRYSADGKAIAAARIEPDQVIIVTCEPPKPCLPLATLPRDADPTQLAWAERDEALFLSLGSSLWRISRKDGAVTELHKLFEVMQ